MIKITTILILVISGCLLLGCGKRNTPIPPGEDTFPKDYGGISS